MVIFTCKNGRSFPTLTCVYLTRASAVTQTDRNVLKIIINNNPTRKNSMRAKRKKKTTTKSDYYCVEITEVNAKSVHCASFYIIEKRPKQLQSHATTDDSPYPELTISSKQSL